MEIRASYVLVGVFTLLAVVGALAFVLWTGGRNNGVVLKPYDIQFSGNVSGLSVASDVLFNGVKVGSVRSITLSPVEPGKVAVRIEVDANTPVRKNSIANLEARGLTGVSVVQITGGSPDSPLLEPEPGETVAQITSQVSRLEALFASAPQLVTSGNELLQRMGDVLNNQNRVALGTTIHNLEQVSTRVAARADALDRIISNLDVTTRRLANASAGIEGASMEMNRLMSGELKETVVAVGDTARRIDKVVATAAPGVAQLSSDGVEDLRRLLVETRQLVGSLNRLSQRMESDPRRFLFGNPLPEYEGR